MAVPPGVETLDNDLDVWLSEIAESARRFGVGGVFPDGSSPEAIALGLYRLQLRADSGDAHARSFLRTRRGPKPIRPTEVPKPEIDSIRVGIAVAGLEFPGGAEEWARTLVSTNASGIVWSGIATESAPSPTWRIPRTVPSWFGRRGLLELGRRSDIVLVWGVSEGGAMVLGLDGAHLIAVSHSSGPSAEVALRHCPNWAGSFVGVSRTAANAFGRPEDSAVVWNGVDANRSVSGDETGDRRRRRESLGISDDEIVVGYVGRLSPEKEPTAAARAARKLRAMGVRARSLTVGGGIHAERYRARILAIDPAGFVLEPVERPSEVLPAIDVVVSASPAEGFSLSLIEAWQAGKPVVSTPTGSIPEVEERFGELVFRIPFRPSRRSLARGVLSALRDNDRDVVERARFVALRHFTAEAMVERWRTLLVDRWRAVCLRTD